MRLRSSLISLVAATALPLVGFAVLVSALLIRHDQDNFVRAVQDRNRAFMSAVDAELKGHVRTLEALASLPSLARGDLRELHTTLVLALAAQPDWITVILHDPDGSSLLNAHFPYGQPLPPASNPEGVRIAARTQKPVIGNIAPGRLRAMLGVPVRVPVVRDGTTVYVITAVIDPDAFTRLIQQQHLPEGWVSGLVDSNGRFIARVPERPAGTLASADYRAAVESAPEGWYRGSTVEGSDTYTAYARSDLTHWSVGFAIPASVVLAGATRAAWMMAVGALACIGLAVGIALWLGRRIARPIVALASGVPLLDSTTGRVHVASDIDEVRELLRAMNRASDALRERVRLAAREREVLAESDRAKDEFIAMLSHELRNPLAALTSAAQILAVTRPGSDVANAAQGVIERQTRQMTRLVEDLLDVSRIAMGKASLEREEIDLADLVQGVVLTWEQSGKLEQRRLVTRLQPVWTHGDRSRLEQVLSNLLDNAVKFTSDGGNIEVTLDRDDNWARLVVSDRGAGIAAEQLPHVFELFVQGPQDVSRRRGGIGVGLALVKRLVDMHGGSVDVHSEGPGLGSRFVVRLPAVQPAQVPTISLTATQVGGEPLHILLVEDNQDARRSLGLLLSLDGHVVDEAASGVEGLEKATRARPDLALVDVGLPNIDGYELARRIRQLPGGVAVRLVALTGYGQPADKQRARDAGFDEHVTKPIGAEALRQVLMLAAEARDAAILPDPSDTKLRELQPDDRQAD